MKKRWDCSKWSPFNGVACKEGEVLAPLILTEDTKEYLKEYGLDMKYRQSWKFPGCKNPIPVVFVPVSEDTFEENMKLFNSDVHEYLRPYTKNDRIISLDKMYDDINSEDAIMVDLSSTRNLDEDLLYEINKAYLLKILKERDSRMYTYITLRIEGFSRGEIFKMMDLKIKKTQMYEFAKKTEILVRRLIEEEFGI